MEMDDPSPAPRPRRGALSAYPLRGTHRAQPRAEGPEALSRASAQRHLDARGERLRAYAAALAAAVTGDPSPGRRAQLDRQLARVRHDLRVAGRARLPA